MKLSVKNCWRIYLGGCLFFSPVWAADTRPTMRADVVVNKGILTLAFPGFKGPIPYEKFGEFTGVGTKDYRYMISDKNGLARAAGEGIFPNSKVAQDPRFKELLKDKKLEGNQWRFTDVADSSLGFYKWASINEDPGVKQFFTGIMFERLGMIEEAVKAYYAVAVHFPKTISYTYFKTPWYVGPAALDRITQILRRHPDIKMELIGGRIQIEGRFDNDVKNDKFIVDPGKLLAVKKRSAEKPLNIAKLKVIKTVAGPKVQLKEFENHHWQLYVDGKPFPIKAVTYSVTPVGSSPDRGTWNPSQGWQLVDTDKNGIHDGFYESYIDKDCSGPRDPNAKIMGDAKILSDLGVNTLRCYHHLYNKELFRKLNKEQGFYFIAGDLLGGYAVGSGASWDKGTDYTDPEQRKKMLASVKEMIDEYKDEPYILMWMLGNENIYGVANNSPQHPDAFYSLVDEAAQLIHGLDPTRPVGLANGDLMYLGIIKEKCTHLDIMGANVYRGEQGFGRHLFEGVKDLMDIPVMITEYGAPAYADGFSKDEAEKYQAVYLGNNWEDLDANMAGRGVGNVLGGVLFEFMDEWWKANSDMPLSVQKEQPEWYAARSAIFKNLQPDKQDSVPQFGGPFLDGWSYEEYYGLISQGFGAGSPYCRVLRPSYYTIQKMWKGK